MTNREYLSTLDSATLVQWILYEAPEIGRMSTHSPIFLTEWLDSEYDGWITVSERGKVLMERWKSEGAE